MFSATDVVYYILFVTALIFSFLAEEKNMLGLKYLRILLIGGFITELVVDFLDFYHPEHAHLLYYIYIPFEFICISLFFRASTSNEGLKKLISLSIPVYLLFAVYFSFFHYSKTDYPGIIYNTGCVFSIIWGVIMLFTLEVDLKLELTKLPFFWICTGIIVFYSGVFFYNAVYNYLLNEKTELATKLRLIVNLNLNYLFYAILIYAFLCSIRLKNYSIR